jgi:uncharacterized protein YwlG (UPF0340 family)
MKRHRATLGVVSVLLVLCAGSTAQLGSLIKGAGVAVIISQFGRDINKALNRLTNTQDETSEYATKVVPIISVGTGKEAGACQIMGPPSAVKKTQAVAQFEGNFRPVGMRIRALVPIETKSVSNVRRIPGVGISGLIDIKI